VNRQIVSFSLLISTLCFAFEPSFITLTLVNTSSKTFEFERVEEANPGNKISIEPGVLKPQEKTTIVGTITEEDFDLNVLLSLKNNAKFRLLVRRQSNMQQPIINMRAPGIYSLVTSRTINPKTGPKLLNISAASVAIRDLPQ